MSHCPSRINPRRNNPFQNALIIAVPAILYLSISLSRLGPSSSAPVLQDAPARILILISLSVFQDVEVVLLDLATSRICPSTLVGACASQALTQALKEAGIELLEPIVYLETTVPESYYDVINRDLLKRRAEVSEC